MRYVFIVYYDDGIYGKKLTDKTTKGFLDFDAAQKYCDKCNGDGKYTSYKLQMLELDEPEDSNIPTREEKEEQSFEYEEVLGFLEKEGIVCKDDESDFGKFLSKLFNENCDYFDEDFAEMYFKESTVKKIIEEAKEYQSR